MWDCAWTCYIQGLATYLQQTNNNVNRYKQSVHCWFWCFHGFVERNKKNVRIQTQFGEKHLQMFVFNFFYCIYLYFLLRKSGLNLFLSVCGARKWRQSETPSLLFWNPHVFYCHGSRLCWWLWVYDAARLHELFCVMHTDHRPVLTVTFSLNCIFHKGHFVKKSTQNKRTRQWFKNM